MIKPKNKMYKPTIGKALNRFTVEIGEVLNGIYKNQQYKINFDPSIPTTNANESKLPDYQPNKRGLLLEKHQVFITNP